MAVVNGTLNDDTLDAADGVTTPQIIFWAWGETTRSLAWADDYFEGGAGADIDGGSGD